jgi:hypothetical protein
MDEISQFVDWKKYKQLLKDLAFSHLVFGVLIIYCFNRVCRIITSLQQMFENNFPVTCLCLKQDMMKLCVQQEFSWDSGIILASEIV